jgi:hypothetical protein
MSDARWNDPREDDVRDRGDEWQRVYDPRDRDDDHRDALMRDLDLPRGDERELVVDRDRVYELDGEDSRTLAAVGAFRVVPEHDLDLSQCRRCSPASLPERFLRLDAPVPRQMRMAVHTRFAVL